LTSANPAKINFTVALSENILFVHINGEHVYSVLVPEVVAGYDGGDLGFGLFMITDKAAEATFSNWSVLVGDEADTALEELVVFETVDYLFLGDSYIDLAFWKSYAAEFTSLSAANGGIGGTKTPDWTEQATSLSALYNPKNIIFHVGINDINGDDVTYEQLVTRMDTMFAAYKAAFPGANLYWITIAPNNFKLSTYVDQWEISSQINAYMKTKDGVNVIDVASKIGTQAGESVKKYYISDGLHFNELGYNKFVGAIKDTFGLTQYAWQAKDMKYDHTANKITNLNTGTGASFMYLNHTKSGIVYIKTRVYGKTSGMLAGVTVSDGTYTSQIYLQNYGIGRLTNYAWNDCQWDLSSGEEAGKHFHFNNFSDQLVANGVMFHRIERVAKGPAGNVYAAGGYFDMEVYIADGYVYIFTDNLLNIKLPIAQINSQFNLADTFRLGVAVWDGNGVDVEFHNTQVLATNQEAMAAVEGRI
jgi:lysophospholipase L1-like esterase